MSGDRRIRIEPGAMFGPFRLISPLGAGGMGEVWRARDTTLSRDVAIKMLPADWAADPERLTRFEIEARAVAQLNHPNILTVYSVGREHGCPYLVTEVLEGRTLRDQLREGALPLRKAIEYATQIARGLATAHDKGIVHRDLKPANIFITTDARAKILDFGVARLLHPLPDGDTRLQTATGMLVGTAGYMAPEQLVGQAADHRADIFAFGVVLSEMISGNEPAIDRVVRRCLEKDPKQRFQSAHDLAFHLESASDLIDLRHAPRENATGVRRAGLLRWVPWMLTAGALGFAAWMATTAERRAPNAPDIPTRRFSMALTTPLVADEHPPLAISPDSTQIAYVVEHSGAPAIWVRRLSELSGHPVAGTEHGFAPFFSPDGQTLGFFVRDALMRVPVAGGPPVRLSSVPPVTRGGVWAADGWIYFSQDPSRGIARIRGEGGPIQSLTDDEALQRNEGHVWPDVSADGRFLLFVARRGDSFEESHLMVRPLATRESHVIGKGGSYARFAPGNRIVFNRGAALFAATFDAAAMTLRGIPQPILDAVQADPVYGGAWYAVAHDGTVAYVPGDARPRGSRLLWVTPSGGETPAFAEERAFLYPAVSPDGRSVIVTIDTMQQDLWRFDTGGSILTRLTSSPGEDFGAVWSPDGRRIAYTSIRHGRPPAIFGKPADANDAETPLYTDPHPVFPNAWSLAGGVLLATVERVQEGTKSVQLLTFGTNGGASVPFLPSRHDRYAAALSPDGRQIAFVSLESGAAEVFVATMPDGRSVRQVSVGGGTSPVWSRDGRRLFYRHDDAVMAVDIDTIAIKAITAPRELLRGRFEEPGRPDWPRNYDVAPDGRFLMIRETYKPTPQSIVFVLGWRGGALDTGR